MSILIKGMDMPMNCNECRFGYDGKCFAHQPFKRFVCGQDKACPLIEIPTPHGRIIDKDEIQIEWITINKGGGYYQLTAPTILEEEK